MKKIVYISLFVSTAMPLWADTAGDKLATTGAQDSGFWTAGPIIALALAALACGLAVWAIIKADAWKKELASLKDDLKKLSQKVNENKSDNYEIELKKVKSKLDELKNELDEIKNKPVVSDQQSFGSTVSNPATSTVVEETVVKPQVSPQPATEERVIFFGPPRGNRFTGGRSVFTPGQSIYSVHDNGKGVVEFGFSDRKEALSVALRSITDYIESACLILGNPSSNPTKVVTVKPGIVRKEGNDWVIENKAQINLI